MSCATEQVALSLTVASEIVCSLSAYCDYTTLSKVVVAVTMLMGVMERVFVTRSTISRETLEVF